MCLAGIFAGFGRTAASPQEPPWHGGFIDHGDGFLAAVFDHGYCLLLEKFYATVGFLFIESVEQGVPCDQEHHDDKSHRELDYGVCSGFFH